MHVAMEERVPATTATDVANRAARFELAPPRHFMLPAILLLLSEEPGYGYRLVKDLEDLHFGRVDRPSVYRALGQLESDALVESWIEAPAAGQTRRVYGLTPLGSRVLRAWMGVIKEERDGLDRVLRRYLATRTVDAVLAEVGGGWASLRTTWSPVAASSPAHRPRGRATTPSGEPEADEAGDGNGAAGTKAEATPAPASDSERAGPRRFRLQPDRSVVLIEVRSSVGPLSFGAIGLEGTIDAETAGGGIRPGTKPTAHVEIGVDGLRSGNSLYDAELLRRIDARRFPIAALDLTEATALGHGNRYRLSGEMSFHGVTRPVEGAVVVDIVDGDRLVVTGEHAFDIRDFDVPSPTVLMLRIYPDVRVRLHVEAEPEA